MALAGAALALAIGLYLTKIRGEDLSGGALQPDPASAGSPSLPEVGTDQLAVPEVSDTQVAELAERSDATSPIRPHDAETYMLELESEYRHASVEEMRKAMGLARFQYETLRGEAMSEQIRLGRYNKAAQVEAGFLPKSIRDARPSCRYSNKVVTNPSYLEPPEEGIWVLEYYVREDEYPDVYRAFDEWRWLKKQVENTEKQ